MNDVYDMRLSMKCLHEWLRCKVYFIYSMLINRNLNKLTIVLGFCMVFKPNLFIFKRLVRPNLLR